MSECFLPHWGLVSQWWLWCWWHQPCHFAACLLFTVHATQTLSTSAPTTAGYTPKEEIRGVCVCVCVCVKEGKNEKKFPSTALPEFLPPDETRDRKRGRKRGSVFQCAEVSRNTALQCADNSRVTASHIDSSWLRERERERERESCQSFSICAGYVSFVSHQTRRATFHLCAFSSSHLPAAGCFRGVGLIVLGWSPLHF